jgi:hypothetical protein
VLKSTKADEANADELLTALRARSTSRPRLRRKSF